MKSFSRIGRPLLLLVLLAAGAGLVWHIGYNLRDHSAAPSPAIPARASDVKAAARPRVSTNQAPVQKPYVPVQKSYVKKESPKDSKPLTKPELGGAASGKSSESRMRQPIPALERRQFIPSAPILFNTGSSTLRHTSIAPLEKLAAMLKQNPGIHLDILGYTDNLGIESANLKISSERAVAVKDYLSSQGIAVSRLKSEGMGSQNPIASNKTQMGRQANRRIEFCIGGSR